MTNEEYEEKIKSLETELYQVKSQRDYWKQEHASLTNKYNMKIKELNQLKKEVIILNQKFNERK